MKFSSTNAEMNLLQNIGFKKKFPTRKCAWRHQTGFLRKRQNVN